MAKQDKPAMNFGNFGGDFVNGDKNETTIGEQNNVQGDQDNSVGKVGGDVQGDNNATKANNSEVNLTPEQAAASIFDELSSVVGPKDQPEPVEFTTGIGDEMLSVDTFYGDHPEQVREEFDRYASMSPDEIEAVPEEEKLTFFGRLKSCWEKCAPLAKASLKTTCKIALPVLNAISAPAFPYNALVGLVNGLLSVTDDED